VQLVAKRTVELAEANEKMRQELIERKITTAPMKGRLKSCMKTLTGKAFAALNAFNEG
jgi:hypothetical protein